MMTVLRKKRKNPQNAAGKSDHMQMYSLVAGIVIALVVLAGISFADNSGALASITDSPIAQSAIRACTGALNNLGVINEKREAAGLPPLTPGENAPAN